jgi:hypothetical protein
MNLAAEDEVLSMGAGAWAVIAPDVAHGVEADVDGAEFTAIVIPRQDPR